MMGLGIDGRACEERCVYSKKTLTVIGARVPPYKRVCVSKAAQPSESTWRARGGRTGRAGDGAGAVRTFAGPGSPGGSPGTEAIGAAYTSPPAGACNRHAGGASSPASVWRPFVYTNGYTTCVWWGGTEKRRGTGVRRPDIGCLCYGCPVRNWSASV